MIAPLPPGTLVFSRYRVVGLAGQGEFGLTYLAQDQKRFDELCILREFAPPQADLDQMERLRQYFHQEAAVLYEFQHPQLPRYRIMFIHGDRVYLVRDYVVGKSCSAWLHERRAEGRAFSQAEVLHLLWQVLPVLTYLHRLGLAHENLSPQSIVMQRQAQIPVLIDLGLIKRLVVQLALHPVLPDGRFWRIGYASPEQEKGGIARPNTDLFSLGAIAIALLLGRDPQESACRWLRSSHWEDATAIHPDFARILKRMVHPNPQKRFVSAQQVMRVLEPLVRSPLFQPRSTVAPRAHLATPMQSEQRAAPAGVAEAHPEPGAIADSPAPSPVATLAPHPSRPKPLTAQPDPATADGPVPTAHTQRQIPGPRRKSRHRPRPDFKASAILVSSVALLVAVISFRALSWVQTGSDQPSAPGKAIAPSPDAGTPPNSETTATPPTPTNPTRDPNPTAANRNSFEARQKQLGVPMAFLSELTDEIFYTKHPDLQGQKLSDEQQDLQNDWVAIANNVLDQLAKISPPMRGKLGNYSRFDYDRWTAPDSGASVNSRELNVLVNNRFGEMFPDQKGKSLNPKTFGQVWYALAEEELNKLKPAN